MNLSTTDLPERLQGPGCLMAAEIGDVGMHYNLSRNDLHAIFLHFLEQLHEEAA